jgi:hypothetical protein
MKPLYQFFTVAGILLSAGNITDVAAAVIRSGMHAVADPMLSVPKVPPGSQLHDVLHHVAHPPIAFLDLQRQPSEHYKPEKPEAPPGIQRNKKDSSKRSLSIGLGFLSGWIVGSLSGAAAGLPFDHSRTCAGSLGILGGFVGGFMGYMYDIWKTRRRNFEGNTIELPQPAMEKFRQLALTAVAISSYEGDEAKKHGNETENILERRAELKALRALEDLSANLNASVNESANASTLGHSQGDVEDIMEVLSEGNTSELVTAEAAQANNALVTANDVARVSAGLNGSQIRGEDLGPVGDFKAFQGDMIPEDAAQLLLLQKLSQQGPSKIAAGTPWRYGHVKYCFAPDVSPTMKHLFLAAIKQYQAAIPCLRFWDVGWESGWSTSPESSQRCKRSPAIFVQSDPAQGCYSYVGMVTPRWNRKSQRLQLQEPGCAFMVL